MSTTGSSSPDGLPVRRRLAFRALYTEQPSCVVAFEQNGKGFGRAFGQTILRKPKPTGFRVALTSAYALHNVNDVCVSKQAYVERQASLVP